MSDDEITKENIVTDDKLQDAIDSLRDDIPDTDDMPDPDNFSGGVDPEEVQEMADKTFMKRLEHLVEEDCDTEMCNRLRDSLDIDFDHDHDEDEPEEPEADEGDEGDEDEPEEPEEPEAEEPEEPEESGTDGNFAFEEDFRK